MLGFDRLDKTSSTSFNFSLGAALRVDKSRNIKFRFVSLVTLAVILEKKTIEKLFNLELLDGKINHELASL